MRLRLDAKAISEDADDISEDDGPVNEVEEFMLIAGGGDDGEDVIDNLPPPLNRSLRWFKLHWTGVLALLL